MSSISKTVTGARVVSGDHLEQIEGYDIIEKIREGSMGQVYCALHRRLDRQVAIKRLTPQPACAC